MKSKAVAGLKRHLVPWSRGADGWSLGWGGARWSSAVICCRLFCCFPRACDGLVALWRPFWRTEGREEVLCKSSWWFHFSIFTSWMTLLSSVVSLSFISFFWKGVAVGCFLARSSLIKSLVMVLLETRVISAVSAWNRKPMSREGAAVLFWSEERRKHHS